MPGQSGASSDHSTRAPTPGDVEGQSGAGKSVDAPVTQQYSSARRYVLLVIFCLAQFLDTVNNSSLYSAIPTLVKALHMSEAETTWIISAFQLTFASFLLIVSSVFAFAFLGLGYRKDGSSLGRYGQSGRISDVYNPKWAFITGISAFGIFSIGAGFVKNKIPFIVLRALTGIAASLTVPSALTLIVHVFPEPAEQARAIGAFGGSGAVGNVLGLIIGAIFVQFASWPWVFWFVSFVAVPISLVCIFLIPGEKPHRDGPAVRKHAKWQGLDIGGVSILTIALILFNFSLTSGATSGWANAGVIAPLIISVFLVVGFFFFETRIPAERAAIPPRTWFLPNFSVLFVAALLPFFWFTTVFTLYTTLWQSVWGWDALKTAVHMIPIGITAFVAALFGPLSRIISPKWLILSGEVLAAGMTVLLAFADRPERYWPYIFPGLVLGTVGMMLVYTQTNIAIFRAGPASLAGTVGAIFNGALQLGSAIGIAIVGSVQGSIDARTGGGPRAFDGRAAAFWFLFAFVSVQALALAVFYRVTDEPASDAAAEGVQGKEGKEQVADRQPSTEKESLQDKQGADAVEVPTLA